MSGPISQNDSQYKYNNDQVHHDINAEVEDLGTFLCDESSSPLVLALLHPHRATDDFYIVDRPIVTVTFNLEKKFRFLQHFSINHAV